MREHLDIQFREPKPVAIILAGGLGTRLRGLHPECPKPMVPVLGRPFLHHVVDYLAAMDLGRIVISTGYKGDQIEAYFSSTAAWQRITCVREPSALGTGGAVAFILSRITVGDWFLVLNGDSIADFSLSAMLEKTGPEVDAVLAGVRVPDGRRFGSLALDSKGFLSGFQEKTRDASEALINAGIYLMRRSLFPPEPEIRASSLESEWLPRWLSEGKRMSVIESAGCFIDIGTPESLAEAGGFLKKSGMFPSRG
jgi:NDP-sugar pyrophosphorylase family protein